MPKKYKLYLEGSPDKKHGYFLSSLVQGFLMEKIDPDYAYLLHDSAIHPYSQSVRCKGENVIWTVSTLNTKAEEVIGSALKKIVSDAEIKLEHRDELLKVLKEESCEISYQDLIDQYYFENKSKYIKISFASPTSFKKNGLYVLFPSERLIFQSLMKKFDACAESSTVYSDEILEHYEKYAQIVGYRLRSTFFHLEGVKIPSFMGDVTIKINGPQQMINMAHMLAEFGTYSGVGIKCGIGMGAIETES